MASIIGRVEYYLFAAAVYKQRIETADENTEAIFLRYRTSAYLSMWLTRETLMNGAASGHFFENHVIAELFKSYSYSPLKSNMTYYRDSNAKEIDIFVQENNLIHSLEIKKSANPDRREIKKFAVLDKTTVQTGAGGIICMCEEVIPIDSQNCYIPYNLI